MSRIRTIKPEFPQSETVGRLSRDARLLFLMLFTVCDDSGRARASSRILASLLYPFDDDAFPLMDSWLAELEKECCVRRYMVEGNTYLEIINWLKHQKIDRPSPSRIPAFDESSRVFASCHRASDADLVPVSRIVGPSTEDRGSTDSPPPEPRERARVAAERGERAQTASEAELQLVYQAYPRKIGLRKAIEAIRKAVLHLGTGEDRPPMSVPEALAFLQCKAKQFAGSLAGQQGEYTPHPATWFNQGRYLDDENEWDNVGQPKGGSDAGSKWRNGIGDQRQQRIDEESRASYARLSAQMGSHTVTDDGIGEARA